MESTAYYEQVQSSMKLQCPGVEAPVEIIWFSRSGSVTHHARHSEVHVDGLLIGRWDHGEHGQRNLALVRLAENKGNGRVHLGDLARAFKVSPETLRVMRKQAQKEGLEAVKVAVAMERSLIEGDPGAERGA